MTRFGMILGLAVTCLAAPALAQAPDTNWDGPDVPIVKRLPEGGIEYTGKWMPRRRLVQYGPYDLIHEQGFPRVVVEQKDGLRALMTQKSIGYIDRYWGGDGFVPPYQGEIEIFNPGVWADEDRTSKLPKEERAPVNLDEIPAQRPGVIDLDEVAAEEGPIQLFSDDEIGAINPRDGLWVSQVDNITTTGCPPGVAEAAQGMMAGGAAVNVTFTKPWWSPGDFSAEFAAQKWRPVGANGYFSVPYATGKEAAGSGISMMVTMGLRARTPESIDVWGRVNMNLSPALAQFAGGSQKCRAVIEGKYVRR